MCIGLNRKLMVQYGAGIINFVYKIFTYTKYAFDNWNQHEKKSGCEVLLNEVTHANYSGVRDQRSEVGD